MQFSFKTLVISSAICLSATTAMAQPQSLSVSSIPTDVNADSSIETAQLIERVESQKAEIEALKARVMQLEESGHNC